MNKEAEERKEIVEALTTVMDLGAEKTVDLTVARRLKKRGMIYYRKNASLPLKMRLLKLDGKYYATIGVNDTKNQIRCLRRLTKIG